MRTDKAVSSDLYLHTIVHTQTYSHMNTVVHTAKDKKKKNTNECTKEKFNNWLKDSGYFTKIVGDLKIKMTHIQSHNMSRNKW